MAKTYDVVIVGGGHNGLVCAAYLAKAGRSVKVLERRHIVGGAAVTEEFHPGFRNSVCSYTVSLLNRKVVEDLGLYEHGLKIVPRPLPNFLPLGDTSYLKSFGDSARMYQEVGRHSVEDADQLGDYHATIARLADVLKGLILETPPNVGGEAGDRMASLWRLWKTGRRFQTLSLEDQRDFADIMTMSAADFLGRWFSNEAVTALYAFDGIVGTLSSPYNPGTAYVLLHHCFGDVLETPGTWGHAIGGMGAITQAMAAAAQKAGAEIEVAAPVSEIIVTNGKASGVRLENGDAIQGRSVAANVNPKLLFGQLVDEKHLSADFAKRMRNLKCRSGTFRMNVALHELPDFTCLTGSNLQEHHQGGIIMAPSMAYMEAAYRDAMDYGWSRRPVVEMLIPSTLDDTLAPAGKHVASLFCQHFNPDLPDGRSWDDTRLEAAEAVLNTVNDFAPNFRRSVIATQILSPLDLEREFGLIGGDIFHGSLDLNQIFSARPVLGHADYRMPIKGLYLCGSGAHPGGGVTGAPGHNAAREILKDL
jgi:phytoene dehydrogenase-like protein